MFEFQPGQTMYKIVDHETGEEMRTIESHWHADDRTVGIFGQDGILKFHLRFWNSSGDHKPTLEFPNDQISRQVLLSLQERQNDGTFVRLEGPHGIIDRVADFFERSARAKVNFVGFEFLDFRNKRM
jgi:hypothetical protein